MKPSRLLAAAAVMAAIASSCTKDDSTIQTVVDSSIIPTITMGDNNIIEIGTNIAPGFYEFPLNANVVSNTASYDNGSMRGISLFSTNLGYGEYGIPEGLRFGFGSRDGYTSDATFLMVQPSSAPVQTRYGDYGLVETMVNFRIVGSEGTFYLDPSETDPRSPRHLSKCTEPYRYLLATVKGFGDVRETILPYLQVGPGPLQGSANGGYAAEILPVTVESHGVELTLLVSGKKRDGEIARLMDYISAGDTIETRLPGTAYDMANPGVLRDIYSCYILRKQ